MQLIGYSVSDIPPCLLYSALYLLVVILFECPNSECLSM